jgi:DNA-binding transcriptional regulator of glucitol operon
MEFTQNALMMLLLFWTLQIAASWIQWKHYRVALNDATGEWSDGFLGSGQSRPRFGAGAVALLSVGPDMRVRQLRTMKGISVFARFKPDRTVQGWALSQLGTHYAPGTRDTAVAKAIRQAIAQIEEVRSRQP